MEDTIRISGKEFHAAEPYRPPDGPGLMGRERELRLIQAAFLEDPPDAHPLAVFLVGDSGTGKTALAEEVSRRMHLPLYTIQGHEGMTADEMAVSARPSDEGIHRIEFRLSGLATAMARGGLCLVDELAKCRPRVLAMLAPVLDHRRTLHSSLGGFALRAHPDFRLIATSNLSDFTTSTLPEFMTERLSLKLKIQLPSRPVLDAIMRDRLAGTRRNCDAFLRLFWEQWGARSPQRLPSPRRLIQVCQLAFNLAAAEGRSEVEAQDVEGAIDATQH